MARRVALCALCAVFLVLAPQSFLGPSKRVSVLEMGPAVALIPFMQGVEEADAASTYNFVAQLLELGMRSLRIPPRCRLSTPPLARSGAVLQ